MSDATPFEERGDLELLFADLGQELDRLGATAEIIVVGGSWLLWHAERSATRDVDSARRLEPELTEAARRVAARHAVGDDWLNDGAAAFWPANADQLGDCTTAYEAGGLVVKMAPAGAVFVMKLYRATPQDHQDMVTLWPRCGFTSPQEAADAFERAYPQAPDDEFLVDYIREIAREATTGGDGPEAGGPPS
ncbi:MAG: hypothetical protein KDB21_14350 [Acidimicrobiales bacterium]|nr:hypothetical protein [Acidimicrobiales bacterium]MCB0996274.1 hypothetical protein [Acidimicrobiales bacterium]